MTGLLERVKAENTPLFDYIDDQTCRVTFVWEGDAPPMLMSDFTWWEMNPVNLEEVEYGVWAYSTILPIDAYVEYSFYLTPDIIERYLDPFNAQVALGLGNLNNFFGCPGYKPSILKKRSLTAKRGAISTHYLGTGGFLGESHRQIMLYHPPVDYPVPLLVVWDGMDYVQNAYLNRIVDNLIAQEAIEPIAMVLILNGFGNRILEYSQNDSNLSFLLTQVLPFARQNLNLLDEPGVHGLLGASMGGLTSLYTALRVPQIFGKVLSQSGAFMRDNAGIEMVTFDLVRYSPTKPLKIWQETGNMESWVKGNRLLYTILKEKGYDVVYREYNGGHNYTWWGVYVHEGLIQLFGN